MPFQARSTLGRSVATSALLAAVAEVTSYLTAGIHLHFPQSPAS